MDTNAGVATQYLSPSNRVREKLLSATITHAVETSPYYREKLRDIDTQHVSLASLPELPLLTKSDLTSRIADLRTSQRFPDHLMYTSGTTGSALEVPVYREEIDAYESTVLPVWRDNIPGDLPLVLTIIRIG